MTREVIEYLKVDQVECDPQVRTQVTDDSVIGLARSIQEARGLAPPSAGNQVGVASLRRGQRI